MFVVNPCNVMVDIGILGMMVVYNYHDVIWGSLAVCLFGRSSLKGSSTMCLLLRLLISTDGSLVMCCVPFSNCTFMRYIPFFRSKTESTILFVNCNFPFLIILP